MKRILALALAATMLLSLFVAPVAAEDAAEKISYEPVPTVSLTATTFSVVKEMYIKKTEEITKLQIAKDQDNLIALKVAVTNSADKPMYWAGEDLYIKYDPQTFELYQYTFSDEETGDVTKLGPIAPAVMNENNGIKCEPAKWPGADNFDVSGLAHFTRASGEDQKEIQKGWTVTLAYVLFKVKDGAENGTYRFEFDTTKENAYMATDVNGTLSRNVADVDFASVHADVTLTGGALPRVAKTTVSPETAEYASNAKLTLGATTFSHRDASDLLTFKVEDKNGNDVSGKFDINGKELTVKSTDPADVGIYNVIATPKPGACELGVVVSNARFEITPATITNPTVTVTDFGKGAPVSAAAASVSEGLTYGNDIKWYKDDVQVTEGNFAGSSTYKAVFTLSADKNHQLAANSTVTVNGVADEYVLSKELTSPDAEGKYTVTLTLKTADKDTLAVLLLPTPSKASYGMTLKDVTLTGGTAMVYGDPNQTPVAGEFRWVDENESVGIPTVGTSEVYGRPFKLKFVPTDNVNYAELETTMRLHVYQATISIDAIKNWNYGTVIPYDGTEHTVELVIPDDTDKLYDKLTVDYTNNETNCNRATNVGKYSAMAEIKVKADESAYYAIYESDHTTRTLDWEITKGALSAEDKTVEVRYGTGSKDLTLADLGLSALANEPGVDVSFNTANKGNVISTVGTQRDTDNNKITGISITLQNTTDQNIGNEGSVALRITSDNYETKTLTVTVKIVNKDSKPLTITGPASFPYGTTAETIKNALTVTGLPTGYNASKVTYTFSNSDISTAAPATGYTVTVGYEDAEFFYTGTHTFEVTARSIADADVTFKALTYNGSEQTTEITVKIGEKTLTMGKDYTVTGDLKGTNAGEYPVTVTGTGNYAGTLTPKFTIAKATPTADNFKVEVPTGVVYDGKAHPAIVTKLNNEIGIMTVLHNGDRALPKDAGEYTVTLDVAESDNYNAATGLTKLEWKFTIAKATPTLEIETAANATYTGQPYDETSKITLTSASTVTPDTYLYFSDADCKNEASPVNVGTYWVKAKFNGDTNHNAVTSAAKQFKITKASYSLAIEAASVEYNKTPYSSSNIKVTPNLSVHFGYYADKALTKSIDAPTEVGTYYVRAFYAGDANHNFAYSNTASFEIKKATPATPPEIKVDGGDKKLSDLEAGMRAAMGGIGGTFEWYDSNGNRLESTTKIEANTEYRWKFIPADPDNYNSIEGTTTPYVRDDLSWLPGVLGGGSNFSFHDVTRFDYYYDSVKWAADNGIASGTSRFAFSPDAVCTRAQTVTFLWRAAGSPLPRYRVSPFTDVHAYDYYYEAVLWAVEQGITTGLTATTFGPDETVTRGQVATFLYRAASAAKPNTFNPFTDVKPTAYNYGAILWAYDNRITTGTSTTTFSPDAFCTRAQIVTFLYRYYQGR